MFADHIIQAIRNHAKQVYPNECCGVVTGVAYLPMENIHEDPRRAFRMDANKLGALFAAKRVRAIVHSHTQDSPKDNWPTKKDMVEQIASAVPWGIVHLGANGVFDGPFWFGDQVPIAPLIGREFRDGVHDCYALQRDVYRLEKNIVLPIMPREPQWWNNGENMIMEGFEAADFVEVPIRTAKPYDVGLCAIRSNGIVNHVCVYRGNGIILHHLIGRLSREDPVEPWMRYIVKLVRHKSML